VDVWEALATAAAASGDMDFDIGGQHQHPYRTLFERARIMSLKPIKFKLSLTKFELKVGMARHIQQYKHRTVYIWDYICRTAG
jgi:hypothetical protein